MQLRCSAKNLRRSSRVIDLENEVARFLLRHGVVSGGICVYVGLWLGFILGLSAQNAALLYFILRLDWEDEANNVLKSCFVCNLQFQLTTLIQ